MSFSPMFLMSLNSFSVDNYCIYLIKYNKAFSFLFPWRIQGPLRCKTVFGNFSKMAFILLRGLRIHLFPHQRKVLETRENSFSWWEFMVASFLSYDKYYTYKKVKDRREGKDQCCCFGCRINSFLCCVSYFAPGWYEE